MNLVQVSTPEMYLVQARFFLLVDLREFFFRSRVRGTKKKKKSSENDQKKKSSENDQLTGHFQSFFFFFSEFFFSFFSLISPEKQ